MKELKMKKKTLKSMRVLKGLEVSKGPVKIVNILQSMTYEKDMMIIYIKQNEVTLIPSSLKMSSTQFFNYYDSILSIVNASITYDTKGHFLKECRHLLLKDKQVK